MYKMYLYGVIFTLLSLCTFAQDTVNKNKLKIITLSEITSLINTPPKGLTIINLWATWCAPCIAELPHFEKMYKKQYKEPVNLYLISIEGKEAKQKVESFLIKNPISCPVYLLEEGTPEDLEKILKTTLSGALPITLIYDEQGKIIRKFEESITTEQLEKEILKK